MVSASDGQLLDASEIRFLDGPTPLPPVPPDVANTHAGEGMLLLCWHHIFICMKAVLAKIRQAEDEASMKI